MIKHLLETYSAISKGDAGDSYLLRDFEAFCHFCWFTKANRIVCLYEVTSHPSESLVLLTEYLMKTYAPMWLTIKSNFCVKNAWKHLNQTIDRVRNVPFYLQLKLKQMAFMFIQKYFDDNGN